MQETISQQNLYNVRINNITLWFTTFMFVLTLCYLFTYVTFVTLRNN